LGTLAHESLNSPAAAKWARQQALRLRQGLSNAAVEQNAGRLARGQDIIGVALPGQDRLLVASLGQPEAQAKRGHRLVRTIGLIGLALILLWLLIRIGY
jgi:hypothetical protein